MRATTKRLALVSAVLVASGTSASMAAAAGGSSGHVIAAARSAQRPAFAVKGMHYARFTRACSDPRPHRLACFAITRTTVHLKPGQTVPTGVVGYRNAFAPTGAHGGYSPQDLEELYNFNRNGGAGQTVGIVDWYDDPTIESDLDAFDAQYGLPQENPQNGPVTFQVLNEEGQTGPLPTTDASTKTTSVETSLDVEAVRAACSLCKIVLVEANAATDDAVANAENAAVAAGATIVSNSFGSPEVAGGGPTFTSADAAAFNHPGVAILASTGDDGWYSWDFINNTSGTGPTPFNSANFPSTLPSVVSVGGTFVGATSSNQRVEGVWNENGAADGGSATGATGGGCSQLFYAAGWQAHMPGYANSGCGGARLAADVSAIGDPATGFDYYDTDLATGTGWGTVGGTSLAAPFLAGMWAVAGGPQGVPYPGLTLYANAATHPSTVHDITIGFDFADGAGPYPGGNAFCNGVTTTVCLQSSLLNGRNPNSTGYLLDCSWDATGSPVAHTGQCDAEKGFDGPSGVGTPNGLGLFKPQVFTIMLSHPAKIHAKKKGSYKISLKDPAPGGKASAAHWSWGDGTTSKGVSASHTYKKVGRYKLSISATDNYGITHSGWIYLKVVR